MPAAAIDMDLLTILFVAAVAVIIVAAVVFLIYLADSTTTSNIKNFKDDIVTANKTTQLSWDHVKMVATTRNLSQGEMGNALRELLREALKGGDEELKSNVEPFERYLRHFRNDEPFEELPGEIRIYLERIRDRLPDGAEALDPLVNYLREVSAQNLRDRKRQRTIAMLGLLVGVAGLVLGLVSIFNYRVAVMK